MAGLVPALLERPLRGFLDFGVDVEKSRSATRLTRCIERVGAAANRMTAKIEAEMSGLNEEDSVAKRRRAAKRLAQNVGYNARRLRRVHVNLAESAADFDETYRGYTGPMVAALEDEVTEELKTAVQGSLASVKELKNSLYQTRGAIEETRMVRPWNIPIQSDYYISTGRLIDSFSSIETTLGQVAESHDKVLKEIKKGVRIRQQALRKGGSQPQ